MAILKSDARKFSFDLTGDRLEVETTSFAKSSGGPLDWTSVNVVATERVPYMGDDDRKRGTYEYPEHAQIAIKGSRSQVVRVLVHALAQMAAADSVRTRKEVQNALSKVENPQHLRYAVNPQYDGMDTAGHCSNCSELAVAHVSHGLVGSWVHLGPSCGPGEGAFVVGPKFSDPDLDHMAQTLRRAGYTVAS